MKIAQWNSTFVTGDKKVDTQHQQLFDMVNEIHDSIMANHGREVLVPVLKRLAKYTVEHFATEEALMQRTNYPGYAAHKAQHDELTAKAVEIIQGYESGKITLPMTLSRFLTDWLRNHIKKSDLEMIKHVQKAGVSA